jgi:glycosyltransferase involved in cell wall biosynthesis
MRIVLLTPDLSGRSGWSRYAADLGKALRDLGHELHCVVSHAENASWCTQHRLLKQPTGYLNSSWLRKIDAWRLRRLLKRLKPDIVHFMAEPYALLLPLLGKNPWRNCMTIHGTYSVLPFAYGNATQGMFEEAYCLCDKIFSVSHFTKSYVRERAPELFRKAILHEKISVLPNAIDLSEFQFVQKQTSSAQKRIISVSAVKPKKGYMAAMDAVALFLQTHAIHLHYDIYGSTEVNTGFVSALQNHINKLGLTNIVTLHGSVDDDTLAKAYDDADVFLLPSLHEGDHFEGFGLVFLEANAHGTPVIGGESGGSPEAIKEGVSGYVCPPEDIRSIALRIADILVHQTIDPHACRKWAEEHNVTESAVLLAEAYESLRKEIHS